MQKNITMVVGNVETITLLNTLHKLKEDLCYSKLFGDEAETGWLTDFVRYNKILSKQHKKMFLKSHFAVSLLLDTANLSHILKQW